MFDRTAIEPAALSAPGLLLAVGQCFGINRGRLAAALPSNWVRDVYTLLEGFPDGPEKQAARTALSRLKSAGLVGCAFPYDTKARWVENARRAKQSAHLEEVVAAASDEDGIPDLATYLSTLNPVHIEPLIHTLSGFEIACKRVVELAPRVVLADPYLDITLPRCARLFAAIVAWGRAARCSDFEIFCRAKGILPERRKSRETPEQEFDRKAIEFFESLPAGKPIRIKVHLLDDKESRDTPMHRRVLLTEGGGVAVDYGFQLEDDRTSDATVLSGRLLEELRSKFYDGKHGYKLRHATYWQSNRS